MEFQPKKTDAMRTRSSGGRQLHVTFARVAETVGMFRDAVRPRIAAAEAVLAVRRLVRFGAAHRAGT